MINNLGESGKLVLAYAQRIATNLRHPEVEPEHLLLGIGDLEDLGIRRSLLDELRCAVWPTATGVQLLPAPKSSAATARPRN